MAVSVINFFNTYQTTSSATFYFVLPTSFGVSTSSIPPQALYAAEFFISGTPAIDSSNIGIKSFLGFWRFDLTSTTIDTNANAANLRVSETGTVGNLPVASIGTSSLFASTHRFIPVVAVTPNTTSQIRWMIKGKAWFEVTST